MKITAVENVRLGEFPNLVWVAATRRSTSRCGTCSARRSAGRVRGAGRQEPQSHPCLQHLRRLQVYPRRAQPGLANWGVGNKQGPYEDLEAFLHRADELALSLLEQGITGMKIWPFDIAAERTAGWDISPAELDAALEPFARIRKAVGNRMDIMVEFHSLWSLPMAQRLARALAPSVRAFYTELPPITKGEVTVNMKPGLGLDLLPDLDRRKGASVRTTRA